MSQTSGSSGQFLTWSSGWSPPESFDEYQIKRPLGRGVMGEVYLAHDTALDREVAIKFIGAVEPDPVAIQRFITEARAAARVQHPNVLMVHRVGQIEGRPYIVAEFVRGDTLDKFEKPLPWRQVLDFGIGLARGLAAAHAAGVLHRDIKPANAIVTDLGQPKLLDFGLAKLVDFGLIKPRKNKNQKPPRSALGTENEGSDANSVIGFAQTVASHSAAIQPSLTMEGGIVGTPYYMAPELWLGHPATEQSDVYSLGILLYELASGAVPTAGISFALMEEAVLTKDPRPLSQVALGIDPRFAAIVDRCIRRDKDARYGSAEDLAGALTDLSEFANNIGILDESPYRGLRAFEAEHSSVFFGRDNDARQILQNLRHQTFVLVAGDSGVGKSSICRAGVLPRVVKGALGEGREWTAGFMVPGRRPVAALAAALTHFFNASEAQVSKLVADPIRLKAILPNRLGDTTGFILFIDQLEELVALSDVKEAESITTLLGELAGDLRGFRILASGRADFLTRLAALPGLGSSLGRALYVLPQLSQTAVRDVIVGPARARGVSFESEELVEELVASANQGGGLPLLQFALEQLWEARDQSSHTITSHSLATIGGVGGALARHADNVLAQLLPEQRAAAQNILLRLITAEGTRARRSGTELVNSSDSAKRALEALVRGRLLVVYEVDGEDWYELAHEILIKEWATLAGWLAEDIDTRHAQERLRAATLEWERLGRDREALWSSAQLEESLHIPREKLTPAEREFLQKSQLNWIWRRWRRRGAAIAIPVLIAASYLVFELRERYQTNQKIAAKILAAREQLAHAEVAQATASALRDNAAKKFETGASDAEDVHRRALAAANDIDKVLVAAETILESAMSQDSNRSDVRALYGDTLLERALLAESTGRLDLVDEMIRRLPSYDADSSRIKKWNSPGSITLELNGFVPEINLQQYERQGEELLLTAVTFTAKPSAGQLQLQLLPGSYLLLFEASERTTVRYPLKVERGEVRTVQVSLPFASEVLPGFIYIPPGRFLSGSQSSEEIRRDFLGAPPLHEVETDAYLIGKYEVTFEEWIAFLDALPEEERIKRTPGGSTFGNPSPRLEKTAAGWTLHMPVGDATMVAAQGQAILIPERGARAAQVWTKWPVLGISAADALAYTAWLDASGRVPGARLCTESEWERAARGADERTFPHGYLLRESDAAFDGTYGKNANAIGPDEVGMHPKSRSPFGVEDMIGNAFEWTRIGGADAYALRGGSYFDASMTLKLPNRNESASNVRDPTVGLRLCISFENKK